MFVKGHTLSRSKKAPGEKQGVKGSLTPAAVERLKSIPATMKNTYIRAMGGKSRQAAIAAQCCECVGWIRKEVTLCTAKACPLYNYRPYQKESEPDEVEITDEE